MRVFQEKMTSLHNDVCALECDAAGWCNVQVMNIS